MDFKNLLPIPEIQTQIIRISDNPASASRVIAHVLFWKKEHGLYFEFDSIKNNGTYVELKLNLKRRVKTFQLPEKLPILFNKELKSGEPNMDFNFNERNRNLFVVTITEEEVGNCDNTGIKRTVVVYEDTDIIDPTLLN